MWPLWLAFPHVCEGIVMLPKVEPMNLTNKWWEWRETQNEDPQCPVDKSPELNISHSPTDGCVAHWQRPILIIWFGEDKHLPFTVTHQSCCFFKPFPASPLSFETLSAPLCCAHLWMLCICVELFLAYKSPIVPLWRVILLKRGRERWCTGNILWTRVSDWTCNKIFWWHGAQLFRLLMHGPLMSYMSKQAHLVQASVALLQLSCAFFFFVLANGKLAQLSSLFIGHILHCVRPLQ